ncbi:hypothetical protein [Actinomadura sp. CNU-125]|uniref:hypothetical protein n=1 Tax=Actinomadura sp. CNU-125 TaxID=1904961 RepID=UPI001177EE26|nr:hypothetical protein [Actinomadura sp. CNU-125]
MQGQGAHALRIREGFDAREQSGGAFFGRFLDRLGGAQRPGRRPPFLIVMASIMDDPARFGKPAALTQS